MKRFEAASHRAAFELGRVRNLLTQRGRAHDADIFAAHATMLGDEKLRRRVEEEIRANRQSAEAAVASVAIELHNSLSQSELPAVRDRAADVLDVGQRLVHCLDDSASPDAPSADVIVASSIVPSELVRYAHHGVVAIITESCGANSHTAILARGLGMPMVTAIEGAVKRIRDGAPVVIDAAAGIVVVDPETNDDETVHKFARPGFPVLLRARRWSPTRPRTASTSACCSTSATRSRPKTRRPPGSRGSACSAPNSSTWTVPVGPARTRASNPTGGSRRPSVTGNSTSAWPISARRRARSTRTSP